MPDSAITDLVFHPGLSTSSIITDLSGRGGGHGCGKEEYSGRPERLRKD